MKQTTRKKKEKMKKRKGKKRGRKSEVKEGLVGGIGKETPIEKERCEIMKNHKIGIILYFFLLLLDTRQKVIWV